MVVNDGVGVHLLVVCDLREEEAPMTPFLAA